MCLSVRGFVLGSYMPFFIGLDVGSREFGRGLVVGS
jgi:hypothetical protein